MRTSSILHVLWLVAVGCTPTANTSFASPVGHGGHGSGYGYGYGDDDDDDYGYGYGDDDDDDYGYGYGYGGKSHATGWPGTRSDPSGDTQVRMIDADGAVFETMTDSDGNFWFKSDSEVKMPAFTGIRRGSFDITGKSNGVACGSCHESGPSDAPGRIWTWDGPAPNSSLH
jgi:hypothetical protein